MSIFSRFFKSRKDEFTSLEESLPHDSSPTDQIASSETSIPRIYSIPKDIPSALLEIVGTRGKEILSQSLLLNILNDYQLFANHRALKNGLKQIQQGGYIQYIIQSTNWEVDCANVCLKIINELGIQRQIVSYLVSSIGYGLGLTPNIPKYEELPETPIDPKPEVSNTSKEGEQRTNCYDPTRSLSNFVLPKDGLFQNSNEPLFQTLRDYDSTNDKLPIIIQNSQDTGAPITLDLKNSPHILVGGTTMSGKSTLLHSIIAGLVSHKHPAELKLVLMDGKGLEFLCYDNLKCHFLAKNFDIKETIITEPYQGIEIMNSIVLEIDERMDLLKKARTRNVDLYNDMFKERKLNPMEGHRFLPYIVLIVDEYSTFMSKDFERAVMIIGQKGATVGVHMIISTSQIDRDTLSLQIRQQFPQRIAFKTVSTAASRLLVDNGSSSKLSPNGKAVYKDSSGIETEVSTPYLNYEAVAELVKYISGQRGYDQPYILASSNNMSASGTTPDVWDPLLEEAARNVVTSGCASTSTLQRRYCIGYNRAGKIMDQLEQLGVVGPSHGGKPRSVLVDHVQLERILKNLV